MSAHTPTLARLAEALEIYDPLTDETAATILGTTLTEARRAMSRLVTGGLALYLSPSDPRDLSSRPVASTTHPARHQRYTLTASPAVIGRAALTVLDMTEAPAGFGQVAVFDPSLRESRIARIPCRPSHAEADHLALLLGRAKDYEPALNRYPHREMAVADPQVTDTVRATVILPREKGRYAYAIRDRSLPPLVAVEEDRATLYALQYASVLAKCHSLLYIKQAAAAQHPTLLFATRHDFAEEWRYDPGLATDLLRLWQASDDHRIARLVARYRPQAVVVETDTLAGHDLTGDIPRGTTVLVLPLRTGIPTLAQAGAARMLRHRRVREFQDPSI